MPYANYEIADEDDDYVDGLLKNKEEIKKLPGTYNSIAGDAPIGGSHHT